MDAQCSLSGRGRTNAVVRNLISVFLLSSAAIAQSTNVYFTGFERSEGFDSRLTLIGQGDWTGTEANGNGFVTNYFANTTPQLPFGQQQAFIGFKPITNADGILNVWRPLNFDPVAARVSVVTFSVTFAIYDSQATPVRDCFRWSVYNGGTNAARLFSLDFDNTTTQVNYVLDDGKFVFTNYLFENGDQNGGDYDLVLSMNVADNLWSAWLNDVSIVDSKPITTRGAALDLGDIDAVWVNRDIGVSGDNYMVFDNYSVTAEPYAFWLDPVQRFSDGSFLLRLTGEPRRDYAIDVSSDFVDWFALKTNNAGADGKFDFVDATATNYSSSFYRARRVP